ncbi:MAG: M50 family metallopeptidase, partial [Caulobacteraceae bacterium]
MTSIVENVAAYVIPFLIIITLIISVHELGHFLVARLCGVAIDRFSIGFGAAIAKWRDRSGVEWRIGWLPLGGYVRFAGDENVASVPDQLDLERMRRAIIEAEGPGAERKYLPFKALWKRAAIAAAGPAANFVLAILLFAAVFCAFGVEGAAPKVASVLPDSPAAAAGLRPGDLFLKAGGKTIRSFSDLQAYTEERPGQTIVYTIRRAGRTIQLAATPKAVQTQNPFGGEQQIGMLGIGALSGSPQKVGPLRAVALGASQTWGIIDETADYLARLVTGKAPSGDLHGVIGIIAASGTVTKHAASVAAEVKTSAISLITPVLIQFAAFLSVSIGLVNLLPIPILDGGHLLFYAYEGVARRPLRGAVQAAGYRVGLALLVG